jgi:phage protein D
LAGYQNPRKTEIKLVYEGVDISRDIAPFLLSFDYDDKSSGEADDLQITLEDKEGLWRGPWFPAKGEKIAATIITHNWDNPNESKSLYCGKFEVDEIEISEPPMTVQIKAVSTPRSTSLRQEAKNKNWEDYTLSRIAQDIASNAGLNLEYLTSTDPQYDTKNQMRVSDIEFLMGLCKDAALALKVTDEKIVIFDEMEYEENASVATITRGSSLVKSMNIKTTMNSVYKGARVKYNDSKASIVHESVLTDDTAPESGQTLQINERVTSEGEAERLAKSQLHDNNKKEVTGSFTLVGNLGLVGGLNVDIAGYGKFDGTFFIESAKHSYSGGGLTTTINIREGGPSKKKKKNKNPPIKHISALD